MNDWERQHRQAQRYKEAYPPDTRIIYVLISIAKTKEFVNQNVSLRTLSKFSSLANGFSYNSVGNRLLYEKAI